MVLEKKEHARQVRHTTTCRMDSQVFAVRQCQAGILRPECKLLPRRKPIWRCPNGAEAVAIGDVLNVIESQAHRGRLGAHLNGFEP